MKFAIVNTKTLGYRQTQLSPKKMNKMNALELFSLLPTCIVKKITSNLSITCCHYYCKVTKICATDCDNKCSQCKLMYTICLKEANAPVATLQDSWTWQQQKKYMKKKIGFMKHHRYVTHDGNLPGLAYSNVPIVPVDPTQKTTPMANINENTITTTTHECAIRLLLTPWLITNCSHKYDSDSAARTKPTKQTRANTHTKQTSARAHETNDSKQKKARTDNINWQQNGRKQRTQDNENEWRQSSATSNNRAQTKKTPPDQTATVQANSSKPQ